MELYRLDLEIGLEIQFLIGLLLNLFQSNIVLLEYKNNKKNRCRTSSNYVASSVRQEMTQKVRYKTELIV